MDVLIFLAAFDLTSVRERGARTEAEQLLLQLVACQPIAVTSPLSAAYRAEQLRGQRLSPEERKTTVWRELDRATLPSNVPPVPVFWPVERERWAAEKQVVAAEEKHCSAQRVTSLREEWAVAPGLHAAVLAYRLEQAYTPPAEDTEVARLLRAEAALFTGDAPQALGLYRSLQVGSAIFPREQLQARQLDAALRLAEAGNPTPLVEAIQAAPDVAQATSNREALQHMVVRIQVTRPFKVGLLEAAFGHALLPRAVFRLASLAIAQDRHALAKEALGWLLVHARGLAGETQKKLAVVALLLGDEAGMRRAVALDPSAAPMLVAELGPVVASGLARSLTPLRALGKAAEPLLRQGLPVRPLAVSLSTHAEPLPLSDTRFALPEVYSLLPECP